MRISLRSLLALLLGLCLAMTANGEESDNSESYLTPYEEPELYDMDYMLQTNDDFLSFLDGPHEVLSEGVESMAQGMDLFFADEKIYTKATKSYARLSTQFRFSHGGSVSTAGDIKFKIDLPKTKKKLKLLLQSDTDRDIQTGTDQNKLPGQENASVNFFAALQKEISKRREWHTHASLGVKLKVPLDPFLRVRSSKNFRLGDWKMRFAETIFWFNSLGAGASSLLELDYALTPDLLFRSRSSQLWTDFLDYHELEQVFSLYQQITERRAIAYNIGVYGISEPDIHSERYFGSINYRQRIHKDWLFVEVTPAILYERDNGFNAERSLTVKFEMVFGSKYIYSEPSE